MPRKKSKAAKAVEQRSPNSPVATRSRTKAKSNADGSDEDAAAEEVAVVAASSKVYTRIKAPPGSAAGNGDIQVISRSGVRGGPGTHARLMDKFKRLDAAAATAKDGGASAPEKTRPRRWLVETVTNFNVFLYAACYFIQGGTLPYLTKKLGFDSTTFGQLQTAFALAQLVGGPVYGRMGDLMGERTALSVAFAAAATSYALLGVAKGIPLLFLSRVPSIFMHVMQGSQMIMTDASDESSRAAALSRLGFSYGIGMVVGPTLGGQVNQHFGEQAAALLAAGGSLLSLVLVLLTIPPSKPSQSANEKQRASSSSSVVDFHKIVAIASSPGVGSLLFVKLVCGVPIGILQSMFSVIALEQFQLPPEQNGYLMSYIGVISLLMQGVGISLFTRFFGDVAIMAGSSVTLAISYYLMTLAGDITSFVAVLFPMTCGLCLVNSVLTAAITKLHSESKSGTAEEKRSGTLLGLNMAVHSVIRTAAPTVGGYMVAGYGFESVGYLGVACNVAVLALLPNVSALRRVKDA